MRSEGFPFIVGVWGWTCVRVACVAGAWSTRRRLVGASLIRCHWAVHSHCDTILTFKVWKVEEVSHEMLVLALPSHKMWGHFRVLRDRRNTLEASQCKRVVFSWQAQHFVMWPLAMSWQAQHFVMRRRCCLHKSQWQGRANVTFLNHRLVHKNLYHFISARFNFLCSFHMVKKKGVRVFVSKLWFRNSCIYIEIFLGVYMHGLTYHKPIHSQNPHLTTQHP